MHDDLAREVARGLGQHVEPPPPIVRQAPNGAADVGSTASPEEPPIIADTADERVLFELLGANFNGRAVRAVRSQYVAGPLALDADLDDSFSFGGRMTAEWGACDVFLARLRDDVARLEKEIESAPSYAVAAIERAIGELRARIAQIERLAPLVFSMRRARRMYERALEAERLARELLSSAEIAASAVISGPREVLRRAEAEASKLVAQPIRRHTEAAAAVDAAKAALAAAARPT